MGMNWTELAQILTAVGVLITAIAALGGLVVGWLTRREVRQVHVATNSMKDQLVESTRKGAEAEGALRGAAEEKANPS